MAYAFFKYTKTKNRNITPTVNACFKNCWGKTKFKYVFDFLDIGFIATITTGKFLSKLKYNKN